MSSPKVIVRVARTAAPGAAPVSPATPDGRSTATMGRSRFSTDATSCATWSGNPGRPPMPRIPSMTRSQGSWVIESSSSTTRPPAATSAALPAGWGVPRHLTAVTRTPRRASRTPANNASPPLLPAPTMIITWRPYRPPVVVRSRSEALAATAAAARCISASTPCAAMARSSMRRIASTRYARMITLRRLRRPRRCLHRGTC